MKFLQALALQALLVQPLLAADADLANHPGYVDFSSLAAITGAEPNVEVSLKEPLLNLITNIIRNQDAQAAGFISKLLRVEVRVFENSSMDRDRVAASMAEIATDLDAQQWERVVRVRDDEEHVDVYFRLSSDASLIHGIAVMVAEPREAVIINIVGDISPDDIAALAARFEIDELSELDYSDDNTDQ
ncbi:MAG: DUF4252 domain-containing protein [Pseudohongiellaceae bacterium]